MKQLAQTFGGAATEQANTLEGQIQRLRVGFDEAKESLGAALLPAVKAFFDYIMNRFIPMLIEAKDRALEPIKRAFEDNKEAIQSLWQFTKDYLVPLFEFTLVKAIELIGLRIASLITIIGKVIDAIKGMIREAIDGINSLISLLNRIPGVNLGSLQTPSFATSSGGVGLQRVTAGGSTASSLGGLVGALGGLGASVSGLSGSVASSKGGGTPGQLKALSNIERDFATLQGLVAQLTGETPPSINQATTEDLRFGRAININVNAPSVIDETGFTRAVVDALNSVERRQAGGLSALFR
jgi:phage-related protein